ncbi:unnamed protein product [Rotaria sp. Silwood1]|nr:unnamed protein product [Rotaria sp. Silwood1]CAF0972202.1 unnamed protein product [Rotaria sp. Silwood1]CAF3393569.1 unnamed protein product [Rotaria sp. Silwood1]
MGPSGCRKTTLLNILAGRALNGVTDKITQVEQIIDQLRIRKCADTPIMFISGGEKKRVNIGTELLMNPSVIFLDEPTSELDSTSAVSLMDVLRDLAMQGKTIITSIHQPSSQIFQSFDQLILLADGKTIFMGKPCNALPYFATMGYHSPSQYNPADYVMDLVSQDMKVREQLKEEYLQNKITKHVNTISNLLQSQYLLAEPSGNEADLTNPDNVNLISNKHESKWPIRFLSQMLILFSHAFFLTGKSQFTFLNFAQALGLAIISGLCWLRMDFSENTIPDRSSFIFFLMTFWPLHTMMHDLLSFPFERTVIEKERATESLGLHLGAAFKNLQHAITVVTVLLIGLMLVSGFFVRNLPHWLGVWGKWLSFLKYAYDACLQLQFKGGRISKCVDGSIISSCQNNPNGTFVSHEAIEFFDVGLNIGLNFLVLFGMFVIFRTLPYLALRFINNHTGRT